MTITDEMVERAALALHKRNGFAPWDRCNEATKQEYRADAIAALEAALSGKDRPNDT